MEPTLYSDDVLITERITPRFQRIKKGDIIIAKSPSDPKIYICKRVTGMPGDRVFVGISSEVVCFSAYTLLCGMLLLLFVILLKWCLCSCRDVGLISGQFIWFVVYNLVMGKFF
jgi:hypothetical protein